MRALLKNAIGPALFGALLVTPATISAQDGAMWRDDKGRPMELNFSGGGGIAPAPQSFDVEEMTETFVRLCVDTQGAQQAVSDAANASGMLVSITDAPVPKKAPKTTMLLAAGPGLVVSQTERILGYAYNQCNVNYFPDVLPEKEDVAEALTASLGREPDNQAERFKKNGKPNKGFKPQWRMTGNDGTSYVLQFDVMKSNRYMNGNRVLFGLREVLENN